MLNKKGFSIIEVVISLGIITVGMFGVLMLLVQNMRVSSYTKNKLIASMLAQEGVELVRNVRDQNWINNDDWNLNITGNANNIFTIDYNSPIPDDAANSITDTEARLYLTGNFYDHDAGAATTFSRIIEVVDNDIDGIDGDESLVLKSIVQWVQNGQTSNYVIETYLFDWK